MFVYKLKTDLFDKSLWKITPHQYKVDSISITALCQLLFVHEFIKA